MRRSFRTETALGAIFFLLAQAGVFATDADSNSSDGLENIIVTANRREQNIQNIPTSVSAVSAAQLKELGVTSTTGIAEFVPGVQLMAVNTGTDNFFSIRGATQNDYAEHEESPVAVYMDGVYLSQAAGTSALLFDSERVEVLRGPQGTLFGRNATAGLVQYISKAPTDTPDGYFETSYGNYNANHTEGAYGSRIVDGLSFRISAANDYSDPMYANYDSNGHNAGNANSHAIRAQLLYSPNADFDATTNLHAVDVRVRAGLYQDIFTYSNPNDHGLSYRPPDNVNVFGTCNGCDPVGYKRAPGQDFWSSSAQPLGHNFESTIGATETIKYRFDGLELTSISDITRYNKNYDEDSDSSPNALNTFWTGVGTTQISQEIHLDNSGTEGPLRWVAGAYYLNLDGVYREGTGTSPLLINVANNPPSSPYLPIFTGAGTGNEDQHYTIKTNSWSEFAQAEYDFLKDFTFVGGARWSTEAKTYNYSLQYLTCEYRTCPVDYSLGTFQLNPANSGSNAKLLKSDWTAKFALNWHVTEDIMPYISWNRGLKAGGFNAPGYIIGDNSKYKFGEEKTYVWEAGVKSEFLDHRARINADVFYYDYVGYQAFNQIGLYNFITNNPAKMAGGEIETTWRLWPGLTYHAGLAFLDSYICGITLPDGSIHTRATAQSPRINTTGGLSYDWNVPGGGTTVFATNYSYRSHYYYDILNNPGGAQAAYWLLDLSAEYTTEDGHYSLRAFGNNVTNTQYLANTIVSGSGGFGQGVWGAPPTFGVRFAYHI